MVRDKATGERICDAQITLDGGAARKYDAGCSYVANIPPLGPVATLEVQHASYKTATRELSTQYETDSCDHAEEVKVSIELEPTP